MCVRISSGVRSKRTRGGRRYLYLVFVVVARGSERRVIDLGSTNVCLSQCSKHVLDVRRTDGHLFGKEHKAHGESEGKGDAGGKQGKVGIRFVLDEARDRVHDDGEEKHVVDSKADPLAIVQGSNVYVPHLPREGSSEEQERTLVCQESCEEIVHVIGCALIVEGKNLYIGIGGRLDREKHLFHSEGVSQSPCHNENEVDSKEHDSLGHEIRVFDRLHAEILGRKDLHHAVDL